MQRCVSTQSTGPPGRMKPQPCQALWCRLGRVLVSLGRLGTKMIGVEVSPHRVQQPVATEYIEREREAET